MSEQRQFPKIPLIERDREIKKMRDLSRTVVESGKRQVLYFQARGGLGKTRLLQDYPQIIAQPSDGQPPLHLLVADIIDMYDFENWRPIEIEQKIVDSLKIAAIAAGIPEQEFDHIFYQYKQNHIYYQAIRGILHEATIEAEKELRSAFIAALNNLSHKFPTVLRFDTFELILNDRQPDFAFVFEREPINIALSQSRSESYSANVGINIVLKWFNEVIPQLQATMVIMSGRPPRDPADKLILKQIAPDIDICSLSVIKDPSSIAQYLRAHEVPISDNDDRIPYIEKITGGLPLLLTLYARTHRLNASILARNMYEFEDDLIEQTFNLLEESPPLQANAAPLNAGSTFIFCLYILACARRGITRKDLRGIFAVLGINADDEEIDNLEDEMLIKTVSNWSSLEGTDEDSQRKKDNSLLLLHDEIQVLIDQSKKLDDLRYRRYILDYLCYTSREQVRARAPGVEPFKLLSNHMYYELTRDIAIGYRTYTIYIDWLLRERSIQEALILSGVFWNTLFYAVDRGGETDMPFYDRLAESLQVSIDDIRRDESVRYVKRLRYIDQNAAAAAWAERLYTELAEKENVLPADQDWTALGEHHDHYLFADLCLTWANALAQSKADPEQAKRLLNILQRWLESDPAKQPPQWLDELPLHRHLIYLRRAFFLGETYNIRGQLYGREQFFRRAVDDLKKSEIAFEEYHKTPILTYHEESPFAAAYLNDDVDSYIAYVRNNLAYRYSEIDELKLALEHSEQVIDKYIRRDQIVSAYQQALFFNTNALIRMRLNDYPGAEHSLNAAREAAKQSGVDRAIGLVAQASVMYKRAQWNARKRLLTKEELAEINEEFGVAAAKLRGQAVTLSELLHDRARFWRDLVVFYRNQKEFVRAKDYWNQAKTFLDTALKEIEGIDALGLRRANLLETRACLDIINEDDTSAKALLDKAEALLAGDVEMPSFAQIIAGKIALQRGLVLLHQGTTYEALKQFAVALARTYVFRPVASTSRYQAAFETLIRAWVDKDIPADQLSLFVRAMYAETGDAPSKTSRLPHPRPIADAWPEAWERSLKFFAALNSRIEAKTNEVTA